MKVVLPTIEFALAAGSYSTAAIEIGIKSDFSPGGADG